MYMKLEELKDGDFVKIRTKKGYTCVGIFKHLKGTSISATPVFHFYMYRKNAYWTDCTLCNSLSDIASISKLSFWGKRSLLKDMREKGFTWRSDSKTLISKPRWNDLCIFWQHTWNNSKEDAVIGVLSSIKEVEGLIYYYRNKEYYTNCIKFESEEQFRTLVSMKD